MTHRITLTVSNDAVVVEGTVPAPMFMHLGDGAKKLGFDIMHSGLARALNASFVFTNKAGAKRLEAQIARDTAHLGPLSRWLAGPDTGASSLTIVRVLCGPHLVPSDHRPAPPWDPSDLGRCLRLLEAVPDLRPRLPEVAATYGTWGPLIREWDALEALYHEEAPTGMARKLYDRMQALLREGGAR